MSTETTIVEITKKDEEIVGTPDEGTRIYRQEGSEEDCAKWFEYICERWDTTVSPGGVHMYVPVSRAAVHKRMKTGKLTGFFYHVTHRERTFFGSDRKVKDQPYIFIPVLECKAWAAEVAKRPENFEAFVKSLTQEDLDGHYLLQDPKDKGRKRKDFRYANDLTLPEFLEGLSVGDLIRIMFRR